MSNVKYRDGAVIAVVRDAMGIAIHMREIGRPDDNGHTATIRELDPIRLRYGQMSDATRAEAFGYGIEVRLTRAAALSKDTKTGKSATVVEKWESVKRLADHYASGTESWEMASLGGGGLTAETKVLIEALVRVLGLDADIAEEQVRAMTTAERDAIRASEEIAPTIAAIYAERATAAKAAGANGADLLGRLKALRV